MSDDDYDYVWKERLEQEAKKREMIPNEPTKEQEPKWYSLNELFPEPKQHEYVGEAVIPKEETYLTKDELKVLYAFLSHQYISYEDLPLLELTRKIRMIAESE